VMGLPAISRKAPEFYALSFADLVLGGLGLMGRLGDVVRDEQGLAYHVSSSLESLYGPGAWQVHAGVNPANVERAIESIRAEIRRIQDEPISDEEEADGKSYLTGILPLALETSGGVARTIQQIELYQLGLDYVDRYIDIINGLSKAAVQEAARRYMSADDLVVVVAGPEMV
jgi:zinc protease